MHPELEDYLMGTPNFGATKRKNIMLVTPEPVPGPSHISLPNHDVWLRGTAATIVSLPVDILVFAPGCTQEQRDLAMEKIRSTNGVAYDLHPIT